jgi:hypothetical protein
VLITYGEQELTVEFQAHDTPEDFAHALAEIALWIGGTSIDIRLSKHWLSVRARGPRDPTR